MQQQQGPRDRVAQQQQMAGSTEFQPPRQWGGGNPGQTGERRDAGQREDLGRARRSDDEARGRKED